MIHWQYQCKEPYSPYQCIYNLVSLVSTSHLFTASTWLNVVAKVDCFHIQQWHMMWLYLWHAYLRTLQTHWQLMCHIHFWSTCCHSPHFHAHILLHGSQQQHIGNWGVVFTFCWLVLVFIMQQLRWRCGTEVSLNGGQGWANSSDKPWPLFSWT